MITDRKKKASRVHISVRQFRKIVHVQTLTQFLEKVKNRRFSNISGDTYQIWLRVEPFAIDSNTVQAIRLVFDTLIATYRIVRFRLRKGSVAVSGRKSRNKLRDGGRGEGGGVRKNTKRTFWNRISRCGSPPPFLTYSRRRSKNINKPPSGPGRGVRRENIDDGRGAKGRRRRRRRGPGGSARPMRTRQPVGSMKLALAVRDGGGGGGGTGTGGTRFVLDPSPESLFCPAKI